MSNKQEPDESPAPAEQLNVRISQELFRRVSTVAASLGKTLAAFVGETLDERTKEHKSDIERLRSRERVPKRWQ